MSTIKEIATLMKKETVLSEDYPGNKISEKRVYC
jgi:hypothetical protein